MCYSKLNEIGIIGLMGPRGPRGDAGTSVMIKGSYNSFDELIMEHPVGTDFDAFIVGSDLYLWDSSSNKWINTGQIKGEVGDAGDVGEIGSVGIKGLMGDVGLAGDKGVTGDVGDTGIAGIKGLMGDAGPAGDKGVTGDAGEIGPVGIKGAVGDKGDTGIAGVIGDLGPQIDCKSYLVAVTNKDAPAFGDNTVLFNKNIYEYGDLIKHENDSKIITLKKDHRYYVKLFVSGTTNNGEVVDGGIVLDEVRAVTLYSCSDGDFCYAMTMTVLEPKSDQRLEVLVNNLFGNINCIINIMAVS